MSELTLSVMEQYNVDVVEVLTPYLLQFEKKHRIKVKLETLTWSDGLEQLISNVLRGAGPDVSEVGTTWVSSFLAMNGLLSFAKRDVFDMGGEESFLRPAWSTHSPPNSGGIWSIPWMAGSRIIYYRKDVFAEAGIDEVGAFDTHEALVRTLTALKRHGHKFPWVVPTQESLNTLALYCQLDLGCRRRIYQRRRKGNCIWEARSNCRCDEVF